MRLLLDTHTFLWFVGGDMRLSAKARRFIDDAENDVFLSIASVWEIAIKVRIGKLSLPTPLDEFVVRELATQNIGLLSIHIEHALAVATLPEHHRDPFDRMLVAQALSENLPLLSADARLDAYGIQRRW